MKPPQLSRIAGTLLLGMGAAAFGAGEERVGIVESGLEVLSGAQVSGQVTARALAEASLARIARYDGGYTAIITPNPSALADADAIDRRRAKGEHLGPLAGIPVVVKDTIDMAGLPTTAGWAPLSAHAGGKDLVPSRDAPVVARLRAAGAVIIGKTNVPVFSGSAENANNSWAGPTYNAAAPHAAPGGSSSGTATAVAASFAVAGLAEETGGSIQCPSAFQGLVGIKPSFGLVPNTGVVPLGGSTRDVIGPIARNVHDAAVVLDVIAGYTPEDPKTVSAIGHVPAGGYVAALAGATLRDKRIGTFGPGWMNASLAADTQALYAEVLRVAGAAGAHIVQDPFEGSVFSDIAHLTGDWQYDLRGEESVAWDLEHYLARLGPHAAARSVAELVALAGSDPFAADGPLAYEREQPAFLASLADLGHPPDLSGFIAAREAYIATLHRVMDEQHLDAMLLPQAVAEPPRIFSDRYGVYTTVSQINIGGFPGIVLPAGRYTSGTPFAVIIVGRLWDEARLLGIAAALERALPPRQVPVLLEKRALIEAARAPS